MCTQLYVVGTADSVLIREVFLIQSVLYTEVPLYVCQSATHHHRRRAGIVTVSDVWKEVESNTAHGVQQPYSA